MSKREKNVKTIKSRKVTAKSNKARKSRKYAAWSEKWEKSIKNGMKRAENEKTGCFTDYLSY